MTMRRLLSMAVLAVAMVAAGCAAASARPPSATEPPRSPEPVITLSEADSGRTVTLQVGQRLEVYLHGTPESAWSAPVASGPALAPAANGKLSLQRGVSGAAFEAVRPGQAQVDSTRRICPDPSPGQVACQGMQAFQVTVAVT
jgi:hypothetical protein